MKTMTKRLIALLMAVVLVVGLAPAIRLTADAATVSYKYSSEGYLYNWGTRGETATYLSQNAEAFYTDNSTSYAALSALAGSADVDSVPSSALYSALQSLMTDAHTTNTSYNGTRDLYQYTDCQENGTWNDGKISSFYSGTGVGPSWDSGATWNREHTWPDSKGLAGSDENDIMMLRPTSVSENSSRGNSAYGESSSYYDPNERGQAVRGDVARIMLYVYVRWGNTGSMWGTSGVMENRDVLLKWMEEDPVDTWELGRNDSVQSITGTRNVFVDYPELAFTLLGADVPSTMQTPSGEAMQGSMTYTLTATSSNTAHGTVTVNGNKITAVPAYGYAATGYTVTAGTATVSQNGNVFTVTASADCTVQITFAALESATITFKESGKTSGSSGQFTVGETILMPESTVTVPDGYTFRGWTAEAIADTEEAPAIIYEAGDSYEVGTNATFHAVYTYAAEGGSTSTSWVRLTGTDTLTAGDQVVLVSEYKGVAAGDISNSVMNGSDATVVIENGVISEMNSSAVILTLGGAAGAWTFSDASGQVLGVTAVKKLAWDKGTTTWTIAFDGNNAIITSTTSTYGQLIMNSNSPRFTTYNTTTMLNNDNNAIQLYRRETGGEVLRYTGTLPGVEPDCVHANTQTTPAEPATETTPGYTEGIYCNDCDTYLEGHVEIPALGYLVSFSLPNTLAPVADLRASGGSVTLPTATAPEGYSFAGWVTAKADNVTDKPTVLSAGDSYAPTANTTLYALYTYSVTVEGGSDPVYEKVTATPETWEGQYLIVYEAGNLIFDGSLDTLDAVGNTQSVTITDGTIPAAQGNGYHFLIAAVDGGYSIQSASSVYIGRSTDSNGMNEGTSAYVNTLSVNTDGTANIVGAGGAYLRYNSTSNQTRFRYYKSTTYTGQKAICLYKLSGGDSTTTYYTTEIQLSCNGEHTYENDGTVCTVCQAVTVAVAGTDYTDPELAFIASMMAENRKTELKADVDMTDAGEIALTAGSTLDLQGKTLTVDSLDGLTAGGNVIDSVGGGKLIVSEGALFAKDNTQLPIKLSDGSYVFETPDLIQGHRDDAFVTGDSHYAYKFYLNNLMDATLMDDYLGNGVSLIFAVTYTNASGAQYKEFTLTGNAMQKYLENWDTYMLCLTLTGLEGVTALQCTAQVTSCGVTIG